MSVGYKLAYDSSSHRLQLQGETVDQVVNKLEQPLSVILQITRNCHFNCAFCSEKVGMPDPSLDELNTYEEHLEGVPRVFLSGGEPLTRSDFDQVAKIFDTGHILGLPTNAVASEENLAVIKARHISVNVGLDGPRSITSRVRGDYDFIMKGIRPLPMKFCA